MHAELEVALAALAPLLGAPEGEPQALDGGITNRNFRVRLGGRDVVVRLPGKDTGLLGIDRAAERAATEAAARAGVGPEVVAFLAEPPCLVTAFIPGRPVEAAELRAPPLLDDVAAALRASTTGRSLPSSFDAFAIVEDYRATAPSAARGSPPASTSSPPARARSEQVLTGSRARSGPVPQRPADRQLPLRRRARADRRLGVRGHGRPLLRPRQPLGQQRLREADDERLLAAYWGEPCTARRFAALRLMRIMSDFREAMWGVVQTAISDARLRLRRLRGRAPRARRGRPGRPALPDLAGGRPWRSAVTCPRARAA